MPRFHTYPRSFCFFNMSPHPPPPTNPQSLETNKFGDSESALSNRHLMRLSLLLVLFSPRCGDYPELWLMEAGPLNV